jgi:F-type H+-transporting ATPase subunit c
MDAATVAMSTSTALSLALPIMMAIAAAGSAFGLGKAVSAAMEAIGRQPEAAPKIQIAMVIGAAFIEALTIYALLTVFIFQGRVV